jgi:branched-chain amino acid transport system permease protein
MNGNQNLILMKTHVPWRIVLLVSALVLAALQLGNTAFAMLMTEILIMALFASSLNLLMTYGHMISFGHAAYFGLGVYGFVLSVEKFGVPVEIALLCGPLLATAFGLFYGALCIRLTEIYFAMLTLACGQITYTILFQWYDFTGGDTGITDFMQPRFGLSDTTFSMVTFCVVALCLLVMWRIIHSPLGLAIKSVGQDPHRSAASGLNPKHIQLITFTISTFFAGVAGTLFAVYNGNAFPDYAGLSFTLDALIMVVFGGLGSFSGGIVGAIIYILMKTYIPVFLTEWELVVGLILIFVVLVTPHGCLGGLEKLQALLKTGRKAKEEGA